MTAYTSEGIHIIVLHIHIVARQLDDPVWPKVVWSRERLGFEDEDALKKAQDDLLKICMSLHSFQPA